MKKNILIATFLWFCFCAKSQQQYHLFISQTDSSEKFSAHYKTVFPTKNELEKELNSLLFSLYEQGFLASCVDSINNDSLNLTAFLHLGKIYKWAEIKNGNIENHSKSNSQCVQNAAPHAVSQSMGSLW